MTHNKLGIFPSIESRINSGLVHFLGPVALVHLHVGFLEGIAQVILLELYCGAIVDFPTIASIARHVVP